MDALPFIQYRNIRAAANASAGELANLDAHIAGILAADPPCLVTINVQPMGKPKFTVSVDINKHTVTDLADRIGLTLGHNPGRLRLIHKGRHVEPHEALCRDVGIKADALVNVCPKLGCPGYGCCDSTYNMLGDALLRNAADVASYGALTSLSPEELDKIFSLISKKGTDKSPAAQEANAVWVETTPRTSMWPKDLRMARAALYDALLKNGSSASEPLPHELCTAVVSDTKPPRTVESTSTSQSPSAAHHASLDAKFAHTASATTLDAKFTRTPSATTLVGQDATNVILPASDTETEDLYG